MLKKTISIIAFFIFSQTSVAAVDTKAWSSLLSKHVNINGGVNYVGLNKDFDKLSSFIKGYEDFSPKGMTDNEKKAAYINLYNAAMIYNILIYAKSKSIDTSSKEFTALEINEISVEGGNIWSGEMKVNFGGIAVNLDNIEHDLIRGGAKGKLEKFKVSKLDPRIHAAVNCAALSCPRVREIAYTSENINKMLDENMKEFLTSESQFKMVEKDKLRANSIVFWYYPDFDDYAQNTLKLKGAGDYLSTFINDSKKYANLITHLKANFNDRSRFSLKLSSSFDFKYNWIINDIRNK